MTSKLGTTEPVLTAEISKLEQDVLLGEYAIKCTRGVAEELVYVEVYNDSMEATWRYDRLDKQNKKTWKI